VNETHPLDRYLQREGHYPTASLGSVQVWVTRGYIGIEERGHRIYIPRNDLVKLLRWLVPKAKIMDESVNPRDLVREYMDAEDLRLKEFRKAKKSRYRTRG
jgi:hypothetical protein